MIQVVSPHRLSTVSTTGLGSLTDFFCMKAEKMMTTTSMTSHRSTATALLGTEDVFQFVRDGNALQVRVWLDNVMDDLNVGDDHGFSLLHWACKGGQTGIAEMLLARGARVQQTNLGDDTALHLAAASGQRECVVKLLRANADVNARNEYGNTPLHYACFHGYDSVAEELIDSGGQVSLANRFGDTPLAKCSSRRLRQHLQQIARERGQDVDSVQPFTSDGPTGTATARATSTLSRMHSTNYSIDMKQIQLTSKLGSSPNGETWRGRYRGSDVVAKILRIREVTPRIPRDFADEAARLRIFSHPNVLPVLNVSPTPPNLVLVSQYMPYGSLFDILHENDRGILLDQAQCIKIALDTAKGMAFLHSLQPSLPRFHLSSKHVMIDEDVIARISLADVRFSFESAAKLYEPAWIAPELLQRSAASVNMRSSDMWSFAVLLWELTTREVPFGSVQSQQEQASGSQDGSATAMQLGMRIALEGLRLSIPLGSSKQMSRLIRICMNENPGKRPTFEQVVPILEKMYKRVAAEQNAEEAARRAS